MRKVFNSVQEKDAYAYDLISRLVEKGENKSTAVKKVKEKLCDISDSTTWMRFKREQERRRKEVSMDGQ